MTPILHLITSITCWIVYSIFEGKREAWFYHTYSKPVNLNKDIHFYFTIQRMSVCIPFILMNLSFEYWFITASEIVLLTVLFLGTFVFFHDGFYYLERNNQNMLIYKLRFRDYNDSTAIFDFKYSQRVIFFICSILAFILLLIIKIYLYKLC